MYPIVLVAFLANALSIAILSLAIWLGWSWASGDVVQTSTGLERVRDDWQLWAWLALLAWSFLGRFVMVRLLARPDRTPHTMARQHGVNVAGIDGASLYVEKVGLTTGPVLLFTHGWGLDSTIWNETKRALSPRHSLLSWDLPGVGRSRAADRHGVSLDAFATNLRHLVAGIGRPAILIGHSIGGMTIQTLARDFPEMLGREVAGVVLLNTTHINPLRTIVFSPLFQLLRLPVLIPLSALTIALEPLARLSAWQSYLSGMAHLAQRLGFGPDVTRSQLEHATLLATRNSPGVLARGNLAMFEWDATDALPDITVPTLVIGGLRDIVTRLEASERIAGAIPDAKLRVIPKANHMGFLEQADLYNAEIEAFVASLRPLAPPSAGTGVSATAVDHGQPAFLDRG